MLMEWLSSKCGLKVIINVESNMEITLEAINHGEKHGGDIDMICRIKGNITNLLQLTNYDICSVE